MDKQKGKGQVHDIGQYVGKPEDQFPVPADNVKKLRQDRVEEVVVRGYKVKELKDIPAQIIEKGRCLVMAERDPHGIQNDIDEEKHGRREDKTGIDNRDRFSKEPHFQSDVSPFTSSKNKRAAVSRP
jgi:hypothetical protein